MELTVLMPCLNEEKTIADCIREAQSYLEQQQYSWEILVVDNGSTDDSAKIASNFGAKVVYCPEPGYGNALRAGMQHAKGRYIVYGDCDMSYDFTEIELLYNELKQGAELVAGNRFHPSPPKEAMSFSHRVGVPLLSFLGRLRYHVKIHDFHCGLRGIDKSCIDKLKLSSTGMEFATEIIAKAGKEKLIIRQVPISLRSDGREGGSHLRTIRDGMRHLCFMLHSL